MITYNNSKANTRVLSDTLQRKHYGKLTSVAPRYRPTHRKLQRLSTDAIRLIAMNQGAIQL